jgi:hypothetical protein
MLLVLHQHPLAGLTYLVVAEAVRNSSTIRNHAKLELSSHQVFIYATIRLESIRYTVCSREPYGTCICVSKTGNRQVGRADDVRLTIGGQQLQLPEVHVDTKIQTD